MLLHECVEGKPEAVLRLVQRAFDVGIASQELVETDAVRTRWFTEEARRDAPCTIRVALHAGAEAEVGENRFRVCVTLA